jgi:SAM-dependent methyltransferase
MTSCEKEYYEYQPFWNPVNINQRQIERVEMTLEAISEGMESLLEVGCGNGIFCNRAAEKIHSLKRVVGMDRSLAAIQYIKTEKVIGDISELPFSNQEFDVIAALEVLEHLPIQAYERTKKEMARVAKNCIIVTVPNSEKLTRNMAQCPMCQTTFNRALHMRSFSTHRIENLFNDYGFTCRYVKPIGLFRQYIGFLELLALYRIWQGSYRGMRESMCPTCGYTEREDKSYSVALNKYPQSWKILVKSLWPSLKKQQWLLGVYERI